MRGSAVPELHPIGAPMTTQLKLPSLASFDPDAAGDEHTGIFGLPFDAEESSILLLGYPWEPTTSYSQGTALGPAAIAKASAQLDLYDLELSRLGLACPYTYGIHLEALDPSVLARSQQAAQLARQEPSCKETLAQVNALSQAFNAQVRREVKTRLDAGRLVGIIGGDHSVPFGAICAHNDSGEAFGILHVDAHADLRVAYEGFEHSHASIMHNVLTHCDKVKALVQVGIRDLSQAERTKIDEDPRITTYFGPDLQDPSSWTQRCQEIIAKLPERVYISIDIDGLDPVYCPNTGTPVPGGLSFAQLQALLAALAGSGKRIIGFDLVEVAPPLDANGQMRSCTSAEEWDANVGARILYRLCGAMLLSQGARDR